MTCGSPSRVSRFAASAEVNLRSASRSVSMAVDGLAALAAAAWCGLNFWRCRHAHCIVTSTGWAALSLLAFTEAGLGRSLIGGNEQPVFLVVLAAAVAFEVGWRLARGTSAIGCWGGGPAGCWGGGPAGCGGRGRITN
jgi:hypothetical protein